MILLLITASVEMIAYNILKYVLFMRFCSTEKESSMSSPQKHIVFNYGFKPSILSEPGQI